MLWGVIRYSMTLGDVHILVHKSIIFRGWGRQNIPSFSFNNNFVSVRCCGKIPATVKSTITRLLLMILARDCRFLTVMSPDSSWKLLDFIVELFSHGILVSKIIVSSQVVKLVNPSDWIPWNERFVALADAEGLWEYINPKVKKGDNDPEWTSIFDTSWNCCGSSKCRIEWFDSRRGGRISPPYQRMGDDDWGKIMF